MDNRESVWVGQIPEKWQLLKLGSLFATRNEKVSDKDFPPLSVSRGGVVPQMEGVAKTDANSDRKLVRSGDFAINSRSDRKQSCGLARVDGSVSLINTILYLKKTDIIYPEYLDFLLKNYWFAEEFYRWGHGIVADLWTTRWQEMKAIMLPIPPYEMQKRICEYLIEKSAEIDSLIAVEEAQIEKLKQFRDRFITEAIKGFQPTKIKYLLDEIKVGPFGSALTGKVISYEDGAAKVYGQWNVVAQSLEAGKNYISQTDFAELENYKVRKGDILVSMMGTIGRCYEIPDVVVPGIIDSHIIKIRLKDIVLPEYFVLAYDLTNSSYCKNQLALLKKGSIMDGLNSTILKEISVPLPSIDKQKAVVKLIKTKTDDVDELLKMKAEKINRLIELKKSLIYEYIVGKKEVAA